VVIAGQIDAVKRALAQAKALGAKRAVMLPVSVASHCELMKPAAERLAKRLESLSISPSAIPVIHNVDVSTRTEPKAIVQALVEQLYQPVRWVEIIQRMVAEGIHTVVECGPGKVLTGLCKRVNGDLQCVAVYDHGSLEAALEGNQLKMEKDYGLKRSDRLGHGSESGNWTRHCP
jgi:[acyl-carrier-protein] S-malonyltransferase